MKSIRRLLLFIILFSNSQQVWAFEPFVIKDIQVEGLQRVSIGTVFNNFPLNINEKVTKRSLDKATKSLYNHGMFKDISINSEQGVLIVRVLERPVIDSIKFNGNKDIETKILEEAFKKLDISSGRVLNKHKLEKATQELQQQYISRGRYGTKVVIQQIPLERNRVSLRIEVQEGVQALVTKVKFIGNKYYTTDELLEVVTMKPRSSWSLFSTNDKFSQEVLLGDSATLRNFYLNRGFLNFKVIRTNVALTKNRKNIVVSYQLKEGKRFRIGEVAINGIEQKLIKDALLKTLNIKNNDSYTKNGLALEKKSLENKLGNMGYALAEITLNATQNSDADTVDIDFLINIGPVVYIREIHINGNVSTKDFVIRRELREYEGGRFIASEIKLSTARLRRLGFFSSVNVDIKPVTGSENQIDIVYTVKEISTGSARAGFTYSPTSGAGVNVGLSHNNVFGGGKKFSLNFVTDKVSRKNYFSISDPFFTQNGISFAYSIFNNKTDTSSLSAATYVKDDLGFSTTFGVPINEYDRIYFGGKYSQAEFTCGTNFQECTTFVEKYRKSLSGNTSKLDLADLTISWSRDNRNSGIFPTSGLFQQLGLEHGLGNTEYNKITYLQKHYFPVLNKSTIKLTTNLGIGQSSDGDLPFFENFYVGGISTVRGFTSGTLSPRTANNNNIGGSLQTVFNIDFITPPFFELTSPSMRTSYFIDAGYAFKNQDAFDTSKLNSSYGLSILWLTPVAPISFTFAKAINSDSSANEQFFQFQLGFSF